MSGDLEARIEQTLADRAGGIGMVGFTADDILRAGRRARTKHRRIGILAAAGCVAAVVAGSVSVANLDGRGQAPITPGITSTPPSATASPSPSTDPLPSYPPDLTPTTGVPAASVKLNYAIGSEITPWDGGAVTVALPPGYRIFEGVRVPGGWVLTATPSVGDGSHHLWWQPEDGEARDFGAVFGNWDVSGDGRTLVVAGNGQEAKAYRLPTLEMIASTTFGGDVSPIVLGVAGDWALLKQVTGDGGPTVAGSWDLKTGALTYTPEDVYIWGMSDDGRVLRTVQGPGTSCVDLVPITALAGLSRTGLCSAEITALPTTYVRGSLSPDGTRVVLSRNEKPTVVLRTSDILAGSWRPTATAAIWGVMAWDTGTSFLAQTEQGEFVRCTSATTCTAVALPGLPPDVAIIHNQGF